MRVAGGAVSEDMKKKIAVGVFALVAIGVIYYESKDILFPPTTATAPASVAVVSAPAAATNAQPATAGGTGKPAVLKPATLDPTLHMDAMLVSERVEYSGNGRNIFSANSAPSVTIPLPVKPVRVVAQPPPPPPVPCPPNCPPPPPPPPIDLKFFGVKTASSGARVACLLQGDNVYLATAGDVVLRRYKVIQIDAKSIQVQDMQNNNQQTLPLQAQ